MLLHLHLLLNCHRHLACENFASFVTLFYSCLQHQVFLLHPVDIILQNLDITVALAKLLRLELHLELQLLQLLHHFLL